MSRIEKLINKKDGRKLYYLLFSNRHAVASRIKKIGVGSQSLETVETMTGIRKTANPEKGIQEYQKV